MSEELCFTPATELASRIRRRDLSPVELVEAFLERIEKRNPGINAYEADSVVVVNRIKPHTAFRGAVESGPTKMLAI
ncbi:MAG: hypothetical protein LC714_02770, partial [Actinobacteria bacterium]|nr:hypothetical protein [Actinomycetota bacterium]